MKIIHFLDNIKNIKTDKKKRQKIYLERIYKRNIFLISHKDININAMLHCKKSDGFTEILLSIGAPIQFTVFQRQNFRKLQKDFCFFSMLTVRGICTSSESLIKGAEENISENSLKEIRFIKLCQTVWNDFSC